MIDLTKNPIFNVIQNGIKKDIDITSNNNCLRATLILIYSGIDTMAFLDMPAGQNDVTRNDFIKWTNNYIKFPCKNQVTGEDLYGARCGLLHTYSVESKMSRGGLCRMIIYADNLNPEVRYNPSIDPNVVMISIKALKEAFFNGINKFLGDSFADAEKTKTIEERLSKLILMIPNEGKT